MWVRTQQALAVLDGASQLAIAAAVLLLPPLGLALSVDGSQSGSASYARSQQAKNKKKSAKKSSPPKRSAAPGTPAPRRPAAAAGKASMYAV